MMKKKKLLIPKIQNYQDKWKKGNNKDSLSSKKNNRNQSKKKRRNQKKKKKRKLLPKRDLNWLKKLLKKTKLKKELSSIMIFRVSKNKH